MRKLLLFIFVVVLAITLAPSEGYGQVTYTGLVTIDSVDVEPGESFSMDVNLESNNLAIPAIIVPLKFDKEILSVDSISFIGSAMPQDFDVISNVDSFLGIIKFTYIAKFVSPVPSYNETGGKLFTIYFSLDQSAKSQISQIDSLNTAVNVGSGIVHTEQLVVSDDLGENSYLLDFKPGVINIQIATAIDDESELGLPTEYNLTQNYPNPFNPTTTIEFSLPKSSNVKLVVFNILGQKVSILIDDFMPAGVHSVDFDGKNNPSGIYFYRLEHEKGAETKKMVMIK